MRIIEHLYGLDGKLSQGNSQLLKSLLSKHDPQLWHSAKNMIIGNRPIITLNKAVKCVTPAKNIVNAVPDPFTIYRALRYCLERQRICKDNYDVSDIES